MYPLVGSLATNVILLNEVGDKIKTDFLINNQYQQK